MIPARTSLLLWRLNTAQRREVRLLPQPAESRTWREIRYQPYGRASPVRPMCCKWQQNWLQSRWKTADESGRFLCRLRESLAAAHTRVHQWTARAEQEHLGAGRRV